MTLITPGPDKGVVALIFILGVIAGIFVTFAVVAL